MGQTNKQDIYSEINANIELDKDCKPETVKKIQKVIHAYTLIEDADSKQDMLDIEPDPDNEPAHTHTD